MFDDMVRITSQRGQPLMIVKNYLYRVNRGKYWRCIRCSSKKCRSRLIVKDDGTVMQIESHNHLPENKKKDFEAVNYNKWYICSPACALGKELQVPLYKFLKDPLIRKYGEQWYGELVEVIETTPPPKKKIKR